MTSQPEKKENDEIYSTKDLGLASCLITLKFLMLSIEWQYEGTRGFPVGYFSFKKNPGLMEAIQGYQQDMISVSPRALLANVRMLKAACSNEGKNPHGKFTKEQR